MAYFKLLYLIITEARNIVLTTACHHLRVHLARRDELSQCADMLEELVTLLWKKEDPDQPIDEDELDPDVDVLCLNTLDVLVETVLHLIGGNTPVLVGFYINYINNARRAGHSPVEESGL